MPNFVQICAIINELWAIDEIQNGCSLEFIIFVHFGQMVYFRWHPSTLLQNFIRLRQSAVELLLFVQKSKMAVAAILNYNFVMLDHPRSPFVHLKLLFKFRVDRVRTFRDITIWKFSKFGLKCLFRPPKIIFWGSFGPPTWFFIIKTLKRPYLTWKHTFWAILVWPVGVSKNTKKDRTQKVTENAHQPNFACRVVSQISFLVSSFIKIGWKMWELWGSKFRPSHWLGTSLIQQLVAIAQAVIGYLMKILLVWCWFNSLNFVSSDYTVCVLHHHPHFCFSLRKITSTRGWIVHFSVFWLVQKIIEINGIISINF